MKFIKISKEEFLDFIINNESCTYLLNPKRDDISIKQGKHVHYFGVSDNDKIIAGARIIESNIGGRKVFYSIRGPILDYSNKSLLDFFMLELKNTLKQMGGDYLRIDPKVIYKQRDINGDVVDNGVDNSSIVSELKKLGFVHLGFNNYYDYSRQNRWEFKLSLKGKTKEQVFKEMKQQHRSRINRSEKFCIEVEEVSYDDLQVFYDIMQKTSERRSYTDESLEYYQNVYKLFAKTGEAKFIVAYLNIEKYSKYLIDDLKNSESKYEKLLENYPEDGKTKQLGIYVDSLKKRIAKLESINSNQKRIPISCASFELFGKEICCIHSGSYEEYMDYCAPYAIRWYIIKYGIDNGYEVFNMFGITGNFDKNDAEYGVYDFKKGFGGFVCEYIGEFQLQLSYKYYIFALKRKIKKMITRK